MFFLYLNDFTLTAQRPTHISNIINGGTEMERNSPVAIPLPAIRTVTHRTVSIDSPSKAGDIYRLFILRLNLKQTFL
jgi:hypothetical protein